MAEYIGAMDQGTTSTRFIVFDKDRDIDNVDGAGEPRGYESVPRSKPDLV